jgi:hypothetical protein
MSENDSNPADIATSMKGRHDDLAPFSRAVNDQTHSA